MDEERTMPGVVQQMVAVARGANWTGPIRLQVHNNMPLWVGCECRAAIQKATHQALIDDHTYPMHNAQGLPQHSSTCVIGCKQYTMQLCA